MKTYIFKVEVEQDEDGRWGADIPALPGCAAWGYTREEALLALQDTAQAYLEVLLEVLMEHQDPLPQEGDEGVAIIPGAEVVTVSL
jgi:predicted RNase H-like HicB family nuclease